MNANTKANACIKERRKRALLVLRGGDDGSTCRFAVFDVLCSSLLLLFMLSIDIVVAIYRML